MTQPTTKTAIKWLETATTEEITEYMKSGDPAVIVILANELAKRSIEQNPVKE